MHDRLDGFRGGSTFGTWLHRVAYNLAQDHARTLRRRRRLLESDERGATAGRAEDQQGAAPDAERGEAVRRALERVPDPHRTALRLHYWFDASVAEIAEQLGVREGTAKSYLHRGRKRLARLLTETEAAP